MKIEQVEVFILSDRNTGARMDASFVDGLAFVRLRTSDGIVGISEIFAVPPKVAQAVLDGPDSLFGAMLIDQEFTHPRDIWKKLYENRLFDNRRGWLIMCLGGVDVALWDIYGKKKGSPVWQLMREGNQPIDTPGNKAMPYCTVVSDQWDRESVLRQQLERVVALREAGYRAFKIEPIQQEAQTIIELTKLVRNELDVDDILCVDVVYSWNSVEEALKVIEEIAEYNIMFVETPFSIDRIDLYSQLTARSCIPIAAGEYTTTRWEFLHLMNEGGVSVLQPYMTTCGGLTEAARIVDIAQQASKLVCPGNWSTHVLGTATLHIAAGSPICPAYELAPTEIYGSILRKALEELAPPVVDGTVFVPNAPGIGFNLPDELEASFSVN